MVAPLRITTEVTDRSGDDKAATAALSPADLARHQDSVGERGKAAPRRWTILAAVLAHAVLLALLVVDWRWRPEPKPEPKPIPVQLMLPPKPEPVPTPAPRPPPPAPAAPMKRESGPAQETTAPPPAEIEAPKPAAPPPAAPTVEEKPPGEPPPALAPPEPPAPIGAAKPKPKKNRVAAVTPKEAPVAMAPHVVELSPPGRAPADFAKSGDRYLNLLRDRIERNRTYPPVELFGVVPSAIAVYQVVVDRNGNLMGVKIVQTTGVTKFDELAGLMIRDAAPFPPLPPDYPEVRALLTIAIPIYPARR